MNLNRSWRVSVTEGAKKQIRRLPRQEIERIERVIDELEMNPFGGDIAKMGGEENTWRRRVGNYRILFKILSEEKLILSVK